MKYSLCREEESVDMCCRNWRCGLTLRPPAYLMMQSFAASRTIQNLLFSSFVVMVFDQRLNLIRKLCTLTKYFCIGKTSPCTCVKASPCTCVKTSPCTCVKTSPCTCVKTSPCTCVKTSPCTCVNLVLALKHHIVLALKHHLVLVLN